MPCDDRISEGRAIEDDAQALFSKVAGWGGRAAALRVRKILNDAMIPGANVLDVGTGPGTIPLHLQRYYKDTCFIGLDIASGMLVKALGYRQKMGLSTSFLAGDGAMMPFADGGIDVITSFFALHHMDHPEYFFQEAERVLKPGGRLLIIDFRRDMWRVLFGLFNFLWQLVFFFTSGRFGFRDSALSAWKPDEIKNLLAKDNLHRFSVHSNPVELWVVTRTGTG